MRDRVFNKKSKIGDFVFDKKVADVFDDMVNRSVPNYNEIQRMIIEQSLQFIKPKTKVYDLGCSTATTLSLLAKNVDARSVTFVGVDNSRQMIAKAGEKLRKHRLTNRVKLLCEDIVKVNVQNSSAVIMTFTLQFVRPLYRDELIRKIYNGLTDGGCLLVVEKILADNSMLNRLYIDYYYNYKRRRAYSEMEISQKREALENVLVPYRASENMELFTRNGFEIADMFYKWYNWAGFIAIKHKISGSSNKK